MTDRRTRRTNDFARDWRTFPVALLGATVSLLGLIMVTISHDLTWLWPLIGGFALELLAVHLHDQRHLSHGETPHAMWCGGDRHRPTFLGGPRV